MKLTKLQRYTLYCILLEEAEKNYQNNYLGDIRRSRDNGFCFMYKMITHTDDLYGCMKYMTPELFSKRTTHSWDVFIFKNWNERIKALKQCIKETHP